MADRASPEEIAEAVVLAMDEHLLEKQKAAYPGAYEGSDGKEFHSKKTGKKGGFRRV